MTHIITIETESETDFAQIKGLAERLGLLIKEVHAETELGQEEELHLLDRIAGSWEGKETGDELNAMIRSARYDSLRDIDL
ncbi:hypothetical protein [Spirosoma foliorum]|uniref:Uncharacterized protein n=1 Tax=Spirosoma foliorum TaxID=2710596 RepID=A0A7G5GNV5_9BACT|nr:hypothetical protein [Spirosoma foliorum]QMW00547.1 hypothetical protein H3H32_21375 [Spirosoma foliorum]